SGRDVAAHRCPVCGERREPASVAETQDEDVRQIDERKTRDRRKRGAVRGQLTDEVELTAGRPFTVADTRFVHADGRIARLIGNPAEDRAETVGFAEWIFDAVATEPSDEKDCRRGSRSDSGTRDDQAHAVSSLRDRHVVYHCSVLEPFGRVWRQRDAVAPRNR